MKAKLILFNKTFSLLLETGETITPMVKENKTKFLKRMEETYGSVDPLEIVEIDETKLEQAKTDQLQALAVKYDGTLYGQMIAHVLEKRGIAVVVEAPKGEVATAKAKALQASQEREAAKAQKSADAKLKAEASKIEKEQKAAIAQKTKDERLATRAAALEAKKAANEIKKAELKAANEAKKATLTLEAQAAKEAKQKAKEEATVLAIAKKAEQNAEKEKARAAAKIAKDAAKIARENEKKAHKEARDLAKAQKLADKAQKAAERANRVKAGVLATSEKYDIATIEQARTRIGVAIKVLAKDKSVKYEGTVNTIQLDKRNGIMMFKIRLEDGKMVHSAIDSWFNQF